MLRRGYLFEFQADDVGRFIETIDPHSIQFVEKY